MPICYYSKLKDNLVLYNYKMCVCNVYDIYIYITADTCVNDILITDEYVDTNWLYII